MKKQAQTQWLFLTSVRATRKSHNLLSFDPLISEIIRGLHIFYIKSEKSSFISEKHLHLVFLSAIMQ